MDSNLRWENRQLLLDRFKSLSFSETHVHSFLSVEIKHETTCLLRFVSLQYYYYWFVYPCAMMKQQLGLSLSISIMFSKWTKLLGSRCSSGQTLA